VLENVAAREATGPSSYIEPSFGGMAIVIATIGRVADKRIEVEEFGA
jgi:hypothetical protein